MTRKDWLSIVTNQKEDIVNIVEVKELYRYIGSGDVILKLSSSKTPDKCLIKSTRNMFRGIKLGQYRPNQVAILWVGEDFEINSSKDLYVKAVLYNDLPNCLEAKTKVDIKDLLNRWVLVHKIEETIRINKILWA